jgi:hypothetical protein
MKNFVKTLCLLGVAGILMSAQSSKNAKVKEDKKKNAVYMLGVSASFTDSLVYFTEVQLIDSIKLGKKELLPERQHYSQQLQGYLEQQGLQNRTCFVYYDRSEAKLKKLSAELKKKYQTNNSKLLIQQVNPNEFRFTKPEEDW